MSHHNKSLNFSHAPNSYNVALCGRTLPEIKTQQIKKQEFKLRYIQLMKDAQKTLGRQEAINLMRESESIWREISA